MKIREQNDYTLGQYVVMLSGERITNMGLHENIKLTEQDLMQFIEWLKEHQSEFLCKALCWDENFCYKNVTVDDTICQKSSD